MRRRAAVALALAAAVPAACAPPPPSPAADAPVVASPIVHQLSVADRNSATPSVAVAGANVAVVWSATSSTGPAALYAAISRDAGATFGEPRRVDDAVAVARASGEQPPQPVWLGDDLAVVWTARRRDLTEIRFAVAPGGETFGPSQLVHAEGLTGLRGWTSATSAADGRLVVAWLDGRNAAPESAGQGHHHGGSAPRQDLFLARVTRDGVREEVHVAADVCFCCKTSVAVADGGHEVAWRHIYPGSLRDIAFARVDGAAATPVIVRVSEDQWKIDACPDDGPSLVIDAAGARHVVWPTLIEGAELSKGVFHATATTPDGPFGPRERLDAGGAGLAAHPRVIALPDQGLIAVWDERAAGSRRVVMRRRAGGGTWRPEETLTAEVAGYYPALGAVPGGVVVVWTSQSEPETSIVVRRLPLD